MFEKLAKHNVSRPDWTPIGEDQLIHALRKRYRDIADIIHALKESPGRIIETADMFIRYRGAK